VIARDRPVEYEEEMGITAPHQSEEITDEMLDAYVVSGTYDNIADRIKERYQGLLDRFSFYFPPRASELNDRWRSIIKQFNG